MEAAEDPFWGAQTSYLNFCEEDYVVTRYIAEFINTLSSLIYIAYGLHGIVHSPNHPKGQRSGPRLVSYIGLIGVGICSGGYHMTLKYHTQMSDELSMHLLTTPLVYRVLAFRSSPERSKMIAVILFVLFTIVMVTHMVMDEFLLHASTFGLALWVTGSRVLSIIPRQAPDPLVKQSLRNITILGSSCFAFGYSLWLIDDWACRVLTDLRHQVGLPLAFFFELHGWWHIFTGIGGYIAVTIIDLITTREVLEDPINDFAWPVPLLAKLMPRAPASTKQS